MEKDNIRGTMRVTFECTPLFGSIEEQLRDFVPSARLISLEVACPKCGGKCKYKEMEDKGLSSGWECTACGWANILSFL